MNEDHDNMNEKTNRIKWIKEGPLPAQIRDILEKKGYPTLISRDDIVEIISPRPTTKGHLFHEWQKSLQPIRHQVTTCMSDPDLLGCEAESPRSGNRRFRRVVE